MTEEVWFVKNEIEKLNLIKIQNVCSSKAPEENEETSIRVKNSQNIDKGLYLEYTKKVFKP